MLIQQFFFSLKLFKKSFQVGGESQGSEDGGDGGGTEEKRKLTDSLTSLSNVVANMTNIAKNNPI